MTSQTPDPVRSVPAAAHPDVDQLADLQEQLLAPAEASAVLAHLAGCADCAETFSALAELAGLLGAQPQPPMPPEVAARIEAALAAETPGPAPPAAPTASPAGPSVPTHPHPPARQDRPNRQDRQDRQRGPGRSPAGRRRIRTLLATAGCLAVLGLGATVLNAVTADPRGASGASVAGAAAKPQTAGTEFTAAGLPEQIHRLLAAQSPPATANHPATANRPNVTTESSPAGGGPDALPACAGSAVGAHADPPLATGHGSYQGAPVDVYVFPSPADPGRLDVYLLTPDCAAGSPQAPATLLLHQLVPAGQ